MCGSATLAIVVSSTCRSTAIITPTVTISRTPVGSGCVAIWPGVSSAMWRLLLPGLIEIDGGRRRQAGDHRLRRRAVERDPDRYALRDLDPIAVRVLRRKQRELAARARANALDVRGEFLAAISVNLDLCALA